MGGEDRQDYYFLRRRQDRQGHYFPGIGKDRGDYYFFWSHFCMSCQATGASRRTVGVIS